MQSDLSKISSYRIMWLYTFFDLPTNTKKERKDYSEFRKYLLSRGFQMLQFSVYIRHCASREAMQAQIKSLEKHLPPKGHISVLEVTDKQFERTKHYLGNATTLPPETPQQLGMF